MTRICTICAHPQHEEIDKQLLCSGSYRDIARQFAVSKDALARHKDGHIPELLSKSNDLKEIVNADSLMKCIQEEAGTVRELRDQAISQGDIELALKAIDRALKCVDMCAKVRGIIQEQPQINMQQVNIYQSPEWILIRSALMDALQPYASARKAASSALLRIDDRGRNAGR